jgi:hypothetical protein
LKRQYTRNREKMPDLLLTTIPKANIPAAVAYEDEANTFTQQQTIAKASEASASEVLAEYSVNDDSTSYLRVKNDITTDGHFAPTLHAYYSQGGNTKPGLHITGRILASQDSGTVPGLILSAATGGSAALTTRPVLDIQNATTSMLKVNADGSLTIDTNLKLDPTGLTGVRTFTFPDVTGQVTLNQAANTFTLAQTINKTAEASAAEIMLECKLSDETTGYARIKNNSTTDAVFVPTWSTLNNSGATQVGSFDQALITPGHDSGTVAVKVWDVRRSDLNAITVRPGYQWRIGGAEVLKVLVDGSLIIDTNIKLMSTGLSAERAFTFPDLAGQVATQEHTNTFTALQTVNKASEASASEIVAHFSVSDDATSYLRIRNDITTDGHFTPTIHGYYSTAGNTKPGLHITGRILASQDSGTVPGLILSTATGGGAALATRPVLDVQNATTSMLKINADGTLTIDTNLKLDATGLTGVRTFTWPDATDEVVGKTATQDLTNKTLTSPAITLANNTWLKADAVDATDINVIGVETSDSIFIGQSSNTKIGSVYINPGMATTPFEIERANGFLQCGGPTRRIMLAETGLTAQRTFTWPDATDKVVGEATAATLAAKTLTTPTINGEKLTDLPKTSAYTLLATDSIVRADASAGAFTLTLPAAATAGAGTVYTIIRTDVASSTNLLTIDANASELINGQLTYILFPAESIILECTGTAWECISQPEPTASGYYYEKGATANQRYLAGMLNQTIALITSTTGPVVNTLYAMPFVVSRTTKFDTISCEVTTGGASSEIRLGIYRDTGNCYPGVLIFDTGDIIATAGGVKDVTITAGLQIFQPGLYWLTYENSATVPQIRALPASGYLSLFPGTFGTAIPAYAYTVAHTVGALPNPYTGSATKRTAVSAVGSPIPAVGLRPV